MTTASARARATRPLLAGALSATFLVGLLVACDDGVTPGRSRITVLDGVTGRALWSAELPVGMLDVDPFAPDGEIAVDGWNQCLPDRAEAFEAATGKRLRPPPWEGYPIPEGLESMGVCDEILQGRHAHVTAVFDSVVSFRDGVCFFEDGADLVGVEVDTGHERFRVPTQSDFLMMGITGQLFGVVGISKTSTGRGTVKRFSLEDGKILWEVGVEDQTPRFAGDTVVYLEGAAEETTALALDDGRTLWSTRLDCSSIEYAHDHLVCVKQLRASYCKYPD